MRIIGLTTAAAALCFLSACSDGGVKSGAETAVKTAGGSVHETVKAATDTAVQNLSLADVDALLEGAPTGAYALEKTHAYIAFSYSHQGYSFPILRWGTWDSSLNWNQSRPEDSSLSVTIDVSSVDSGVAKFDDHLLSADFFDVAQYPAISFKSTSVTRGPGLKGKLTGDLSIKGVTKPVTLDVTFNKAGEARGGGHKLGFSASGSLKRSDFDLGAYVPHVGNEVKLDIQVEYVMPEG